MNTEVFKTDVPARVKSVNGMSWYDARIVGLSKTGAMLEGRFVQKQDMMVEIFVPSPDPKKKPYYIVGLVVAVEENKLSVRFL